MGQSGIVDFRSDTVTMPTEGMRRAMAAAAVGDDVYQDDPTVKELEARMAALAGMEAGLFLPSGTQSNLVGLMAHCERGDEYLVGQDAHTYKYEAGGAAVLASIQPQPIENAPDGSIPLAKLRAAIKPIDIHFARTRLIALENTIGGKVLPSGYAAEVARLAREFSLLMHLDGARIFNASIASATSVADLCAPFDSVSICLSKGLGAPIGSVLCGTRSYVESGRRWRKMLGGGMRQAGIIAAAGLYALDHHVERLAEDHENARRLAEGLAAIEGVTVQATPTNIIYAAVAEERVAGLERHLVARAIRATVKAQMRLVTHLGVDRLAVDRTIDAFATYFAK